MNMTHLRIGNIILCNDKPEIITGVLQYGVYFAFGYCPNVKGFLQPVPISWDWLKKARFEKTDGFYVSEDSEIKLTHDFIVWKPDVYRVRIDSVHQLQNFHLDLKQKQLVIALF